ncbi:hypothetical protein ACFSYD_11800 [Paracoccus aerius]
MDLERQFEAERRQEALREDPLLKCQTVTDAVMDIANTGMTADEFRAVAAPATVARLQRYALPAFRFLKGIVEVGHDQKRAG